MTLLEILNKLDRARREFEKRSIVCFTSDLDWASETACSRTLSFFSSRNIPVTYFLTHQSHVMTDALQRGVIRAGIHPNFMPGSSQGGNYQEIVDFCMNLMPNPRCYRGHRYYEVNDTAELLYQRGIEFESNICTLMDIVPPFLHRSKMINFPIFWEDGAYLYHEGNFDFSEFYNRLRLPGLKIINIHPMHLVLNTPYFSYTRQIKDDLSREAWNRMDESAIEQLSWKGSGIAGFIRQMTDAIIRDNIEMAYLEDIYDEICRK